MHLSTKITDNKGIIAQTLSNTRSDRPCLRIMLCISYFVSSVQANKGFYNSFSQIGKKQGFLNYWQAKCSQIGSKCIGISYLVTYQQFKKERPWKMCEMITFIQKQHQNGLYFTSKQFYITNEAPSNIKGTLRVSQPGKICNYNYSKFQRSTPKINLKAKFRIATVKMNRKKVGFGQFLEGLWTSQNQLGATNSSYWILIIFHFFHRTLRSKTTLQLQIYENSACLTRKLQLITAFKCSQVCTSFLIYISNIIIKKGKLILGKFAKCVNQEQKLAFRWLYQVEGVWIKQDLSINTKIDAKITQKVRSSFSLLIIFKSKIIRFSSSFQLRTVIKGKMAGQISVVNHYFQVINFIIFFQTSTKFQKTNSF